MKNTILKYTKIVVDDFEISDYFSKKINIQHFVIEYPNLFSKYKLMNDDRLENISYQLYGTSDYWDSCHLASIINPNNH